MPVTGGAAHHYPSTVTSFFEPPDPPADLPPAATDPTSVVGLRALARERPGDWHCIVMDASPTAPDDLADLTVAQVLRSELADQLRPRHPRDLGRLMRYRGCARRLVELVGETGIASVDNTFLIMLHGMLTDASASPTGRVYAPSTAGRTTSLLRRIAIRWAHAAGREPLVTPGRGDPIRRGRRAASALSRHRPTPNVEQLFSLLLVAGEDLQVAIALAAGGGLHHGQVRKLHVDQIDPQSRAVSMPVPGRGFRVAWLAGWAWDLLEPHYSVMRSYSRPGGLLLPGGLGGEPRGDFNRPLATACRRAFGPDGPQFTMASLRRFWQTTALASGLPRAIVRQSWAVRDFQRLPVGAAAARDWARGWSELFTGPDVLLAGAVAVPRRAADEVGPWEVEKAPSGALLPASCQKPLEL